MLFKIRRDFIAMLSEKNITRKTKWSSLKKQLEDDGRYKAVDRSSSREALFREYQDSLPDESASVILSQLEIFVMRVCMGQNHRLRITSAVWCIRKHFTRNVIITSHAPHVAFIQL